MVHVKGWGGEHIVLFPPVSKTNHQAKLYVLKHPKACITKRISPRPGTKFFFSGLAKNMVTRLGFPCVRVFLVFWKEALGTLFVVVSGQKEIRVLKSRPEECGGRLVGHLSGLQAFPLKCPPSRTRPSRPLHLHHTPFLLCPPAVGTWFYYSAKHVLSLASTCMPSDETTY